MAFKTRAPARRRREQGLERRACLDVHGHSGDGREPIDLVVLGRAPDRRTDHVVDEAILVREDDPRAARLAGLQDRDRRRESVHQRDLSACGSNRDPLTNTSSLSSPGPASTGRTSA